MKFKNTNISATNTIQKKYLLIYFVISILFMLCLSTSTSPLYNIPYAGDTAMFQTIGKYWAEGSLPYVDLWDSKGPLIFAVNALGYLLTGQRWGIMIIQVICLFITLIMIDRIISQYITGKKVLLFSLLFLGAYSLVYANNCTEEYILPLLTASLYGFTVYIENARKNNYVHNPLWSLLYGITFAACFLTRLTNALGICGGVFVIVCMLIISKNFKNLFQNAIMFIAGFLILTLPFLLYFYFNHAFNDFLYGTFTYNLEYAGNSHFKIYGNGILAVLASIFSFMSGPIVAVIGIICLFKKSLLKGFMYIFIGLLPFIWFIKSNGYLHYAIITIPYYGLIISAVYKEFIQKNKKSKIIKILLMSVCILQCAFGVLYTGKNTLISIYNNSNIHEVSEYNKVETNIIKMIPESERDSFIAYNTNNGIYLQMDIKPCYPYFTMQDWAISCNNSLGTLVTEAYSSCKAKWILVEDNGTELCIDDILKEHYSIAYEENKPFSSTVVYKLYKLNN